MARLPIPTRAAKPQVHNFAEQVATSLSLEPGEPLESIVTRLGGRIVYGTNSASAQSSPSIEVRAPNDFTIHLPSTTSPQRDRFTLAHELGHLYLHFPMVRQAHPTETMIATRWVDESDPLQQRAEWEANWFAAAFLMPSASFIERYKEYGFSLSQVASFFGVSEQAAEIRKKSLGIS